MTRRLTALAVATLLFACAPVGRPTPERPSLDPSTGGQAVSGLPGAPAPSDPRERALWQAMTEPDLVTRSRLLQEIAGSAPPSDRLGRLARVERVKALADLGDLPAMEAAAGELEIGDDAEGADLLNRLAYAAAEHHGDLEKANTRARRALEIVAALQRPKGVTADLWKRQIAGTSAAMRDTLGWVLVQAGDPTTGLKELDQAAEITPDDVAVSYHRGRALEARGAWAKAMDAYVRAVVGEGGESAPAQAGVERMRQKLGWTEETTAVRISEAEGALAKRIRERVLPHRVDDPAPELSARQENGEPVSLASRRGHPVILVFFASYSLPSLAALEAALRAAPGATIGVAEDPHAGNARAAASRFGVGFPVALDTGGADAAAWGVKSLPLAAVLDTAGRVRYRNEGVLPGYGRMLKMELESLEGASR